MTCKLLLNFLFILFYNGLLLISGGPVKESPIPIEAIYQGLKLRLEKGGESSSSNVHHQQNEAEGAILEHLDEKGQWKFEGAEFTVDGKRYEFKEYAPKLFAHLRGTIFGIDHGKYSQSLIDGIKPYVNPGNGGSIFFMSSDERFLLKSVHLDCAHLSGFEDRILRQHLPAYAKYMGENGNSFLTKYLGLYSIEEVEDRQKLLWFFVMPNLLKPESVPSGRLPRIDYRFDIKGYHMPNRVAGDREKAKEHPTYRDVDFNFVFGKERLFPKGISLARPIYERVVGMLEKDAQFLAKTFNTLDYSLFFGVHFNDEKEKDKAEGSDDSLNGGIPAHCVDCKLPPGHLAAQSSSEKPQRRHSLTLYVGIIDLLTAKLVNHHWQKKAGWCYSETLSHAADKAIFELYGLRFKNFVKNHVFKVEN